MSSNASLDTKQTDVEMKIENIEGRLFFILNLHLLFAENSLV